jgi:hypothetical protein
LVGGSKLPFLARGLFRLRSLRERLIDLEPRPIRDERNSALDDLHAPTRASNPISPLLKGVEIEMPKPADLAVLGLRPNDYFHGYSIAVKAEGERLRDTECLGEWTGTGPRSLSQFHHKATTPQNSNHN